jgi:hypothetical protein
MPTFPFHEDDLDEITEPPIDPEDSEPALEESFVLEHFAEVDREDDLILATLQGKTPDASDTYEKGQLSRPMNEYTTRLLIQCCFPTLFPDGQGGLHPIECESPREHTYSLAEYCEHLIAWHDRRFVVHPTFKFYCLNEGRWTVCSRKCTRNTTLTMKAPRLHPSIVGLVVSVST